MKGILTDQIITRAAANTDCGRVQQLVADVLSEYGLDFDPDGTDRDLLDIEANYPDRGGIFEIIEDAEGNLLGTVGLYLLDGETVELRKMYFAGELRGKGFGKRTLTRMIEKARALGFRKVYLETASVLVEAIGLYESFGFKPVGDFHSPRCDKAYVLEID